MGKPLAQAKKKTYYFQVHEDWFNSDAFRTMQLPARSLLLEFLNIYRPSRNGALVISTRQAKEKLGVAESTAIKAFHELVEHGFLILINYHNWTERKAREFELTIKNRDGREPKDLWKLWKPNEPVRYS